VAREKRIRRDERTRGGSAIQAGPPPAPTLSFSLKYLQDHPHFDPSGRNVDYFRTLLARIRDLCTLQVLEFRNQRSKTLRIHRIEFGDARVTVTGFGIPGGEEYDEEAWQFALSANEHGRVHGFLIADTFYVRWLDPDHNLYARKN
jgi:hypothetical protein